MPLPPCRPGMTGFWPAASISASRPSRRTGLSTTACVRYVPGQTTTVPPATTAWMAPLIVVYLAVAQEVSALPDEAWCET